MKTAAALIVAVVLAPPVAGYAGQAESRKPLGVLFVGNSYTYVNDLPSMIQALAAADRGARPIVIARVLQGGAHLQWHWTGKGRTGKPVKKHARAAIEKGDFDFVVIQEQSQMPVVAPPVTVKYATLLCQAVRKRGAMPVMFMTWARKGEMKDPRGGKPTWTSEKMQAQLAETYIQAGKQGRALVAPVGLAWAAVRKGRPEMVLHKGDGSHPGAYGSYLAACVFHVVLTGRTPVGLPAKLTAKAGAKTRTLASIPPADAEFLQKTAQKTVEAFRAKHPDPPKPSGSASGNVAGTPAGSVARESSKR